VNAAVLDASVALRWILEDEADREGALRIRAALEEGRLLADAPPTFLPEVAGALTRAVRAGRMTAAAAFASLDGLSRVGVDTPELHAFVQDSMRIAMRTGIQVQDATYIRTAQRLGVPLVSADRAQLAAAAAVAVVAVPLASVPPFEP